MNEIAPVEATVWIPATPPDVFGFFTDPDRYVQWMGSSAELDPVPGGVYRVRMADGFAAAGRFLAVSYPHSVVFSWGFADDEAASRTKHADAGPGERTMPAGSTRVTVTLLDEGGGTRLRLRHENLPSESLREGHDVAWNTYLPRLAIRAAGGDPGPDPHA
ncbi:MAG TPA: SRPBCC domain-containing protein [Streptosporangiaceae bacterium]|jgi:uncharacterized protein YndB with AHSA1/START domain|nr:SRPBCC domain-containing protein [Streptosporangiaceae bacterium]HEX3309875.1 SRPBCC domain-containing protein [Streptosporangiaceae bacterium]